jgi:hypothetical protein
METVKIPTLKFVWEAQGLQRVFKSHMISLFCPEGILFKERVAVYKQFLGKGAMDDAEMVCEMIIKHS